MPRRLLDKKIIEISFPESLIESEDYFDNSYRGYTSSSDEELFCENKSEVLWSREKSEFFSENDFFRDTANDFSNTTGRTVSSCSWHNDEFDMKSTSKVKASLEAIDNALYEGQRETSMCQELFEECYDWSQKFPYLRLKGQQIVKPVEDSIMLYSTTPVPIKSSDHCDNSSSCDFCDKEVLEYNSVRSVSFVKSMHQRIIEKLADLMFSDVLSAFQTIKEKNYGEDIHLPPITTITDNQCSIYLQRPRTEGQSSALTDFPKLSDILTVSPKVLQRRKEYRTGSGVQRVPRPTSEISLLCRNSDVISSSKSSSYKSVSQQKIKNYISPNAKSPFTKVKKPSEKDADVLQLFLPALEEDSVESPDILQGIHLEPEMRPLSSKGPLSARFCESSHISLKSDSFLPPIEDKNHISSSSKFNKNLFMFYGSHVKSGKSTSTRLASAKISNISCRTGTSTSRYNFSNSDSMSHKCSTNYEYLSTKKNSNKNPLSQCNEYNSNMLLRNSENTYDKDNEVKPVTLFPIVTSLVPQRERSVPNAKKEGLFGSLLGGKKR